MQGLRHLPHTRTCSYIRPTAKSAKKSVVIRAQRTSASGRFIVVKPATQPKRLKLVEIRNAVRKVIKEQDQDKQ